MKINKAAISHSIFIVNFNINVLTSLKPYLESEQIEKYTKVYVGKIIISSLRVYYRLKENEYKNTPYTNILSICFQTLVE